MEESEFVGVMMGLGYSELMAKAIWDQRPLGIEIGLLEEHLKPVFGRPGRLEDYQWIEQMVKEGILRYDEGAKRFVEGDATVD